ncbi:MAG: hypothetical protein O7D95_06160 [Betaproteobacteria bacterium]|nr:hypothetical protein [Betaproteobacteria bacterium]
MRHVQNTINIGAAGTAATAPADVEIYINVLAVNGILGIAYAQWFQIIAASWVLILILKQLGVLLQYLRDKFA